MSMGYNLLGENIIEQMKQVKEERKYLERIREELIKKVERLLEQGKLKRYHGKVYYVSFITIKETQVLQIYAFGINDKMIIFTILLL